MCRRRSTSHHRRRSTTNSPGWSRRQRFRWDRYDQKGLPFDEEKTINVEFVMPSKKPEEPKPPIDVTPQAAGPEQPVADVPRIEGPRPRFETGTGAVYEMPRSAFEQPDPQG